MPTSITTKILAANWLVVLIGLPFWYSSTYVERHGLPSHRVDAWTQRRPCYLESLKKQGGCGSIAQSGGNPAKDLRVLPYNQDVELVFSLMNEDYSIPGGIANWDVNPALRDHILPVLQALESLHNFTIETQMSYYAPLSIRPDFDESRQQWTIEQEELKSFVNSAEWNFPSTSSTSRLEFVLFIPSSHRRPLTIKDRTERSFITPQWGGVVIYNPLSQVSRLTASDLTSSFELFASQLAYLLGISPSVSSEKVFSSTHLSALLQDRTWENLEEAVLALEGVVNLTQSLTNIPISAQVRDDFVDALDALDAASVARGEEEQLTLSARARKLGNRAFFNPKMVGMLYFPDEHKYVVYAPLLGPLAIQLVTATLSQLKKWRKRRQDAKLKTE